MAAEFIAEEGELKGLILSLEEGDHWIIGRDPDQSDIVIEDPKASRRHLLCRKTNQGYVIENLSDTNPVLINGVPIRESTLLNDGDKVMVGGTLFGFYSEESEHAGFAFVKEAPFEADEFSRSFEEQREEDAKETDTIEEAPEEKERETIFEEAEIPELSIDLTGASRFLLKVIAGPNTGAEVSLDLGRKYLIGTDAATADIVFNDLSVSREHALLEVSKEGDVTIEDLGSRNGIVLDRQRIVGKTPLSPNAVVALGTTVFLLIDREAPQETITTPVFEEPTAFEEKEKAEKIVEKEKELKKPGITAGSFILALIIAALAVLLGIGLVSLLETKEVETEHYDYMSDLQAIMKDFPAIRYTYNKSNGKLFLMGHVKTGIEHNELLYKLRALPFIKGIEDNVVNDEAIWQEMNILLSKHPDFKGVSMHSPEAGQFVLTGFLKTEKQSAELSDYINLHFNYLSLLQNLVIVEEQVREEVSSELLQKGFGAVSVSFSNGELQLTGYISSTQRYEFENLLDRFQRIPGVRTIRNFVVMVSPEQGVIDLNKRYPGRYRVTGYSKHGDVNINVVINGRILTRGDQIDGMTITSIQPNAVFLEKEGLKYKIEYNK